MTEDPLTFMHPSRPLGKSGTTKIDAGVSLVGGAAIVGVSLAHGIGGSFGRVVGRSVSARVASGVSTGVVGLGVGDGVIGAGFVDGVVGLDVGDEEIGISIGTGVVGSGDTPEVSVKNIEQVHVAIGLTVVLSGLKKTPVNGTVLAIY